MAGNYLLSQKYSSVIASWLRFTGETPSVLGIWCIYLLVDLIALLTLVYIINDILTSTKNSLTWFVITASKLYMLTLDRNKCIHVSNVYNSTLECITCRPTHCLPDRCHHEDLRLTCICCMCLVEYRLQLLNWIYCCLDLHERQGSLCSRLLDEQDRTGCFLQLQWVWEKDMPHCWQCSGMLLASPMQ